LTKNTDEAEKLRLYIGYCLGYVERYDVWIKGQMDTHMMRPRRFSTDSSVSQLLTAADAIDYRFASET